MDLNNKSNTHKKGSDGVSEKYLYDVEKQLYNTASNYIPHLKRVSMKNKLEDLTDKN
jgi:hypothetical protein